MIYLTHSVKSNNFYQISSIYYKISPMAIHNFGVIKATFTNYMNESENLHAKDMFGKFMQLIKESKFLKTEFEVYKNLENKYIPNENLAIKYIDECIDLFSSLNISSYNEARNKSVRLVEGLDIKVSSKKQELYRHIDTLIFESLTPEPNVDSIHESFSFVLEFIKTNKPKLVESTHHVDVDYSAIPAEFLIKKSIAKFNERYESLNETDKVVFKSIVSENVVDKQKVFTTLKEETTQLLKSLLELSKDMDNEKINESISKISTMSFNSDTYPKDVVSLHDLKTSLTQ